MKISKPFDYVVGYTATGEIVSYSPFARLVAIGLNAVGVYPNEMAEIQQTYDEDEKLKFTIECFNRH